MNLAQEGYEAYANHTGWKSLATGQPLPQWDANPWVWVVEFKRVLA